VNLQKAVERGVGKALIVSVAFHVFVIALVIVCASGNVKKHPETITIFLTDAGLPGGRGTAGKAGPVRVGMKLRSPTHAKQSRSPERERSELAIPGTTKPSAPKPETDNEMPMKKIAMEIENPTLSTFSAGPLMVSAAPGDAAEGRGSGGGTGAGIVRAGTSGDGSSSGSGADNGADGGKKQYLERNFGYIRDLIVKNLKYPSVARQMGWKGSVTVAFVILENGNTEAIRVTQSSGHDLLDQSVLKTVRALQPFPRPPARAELIIPIAFRLE
jgi:protein TonB